MRLQLVFLLAALPFMARPLSAQTNDADKQLRVQSASPADHIPSDPEVLLVVSDDRKTIAAYSTNTSRWDRLEFQVPLMEKTRPVTTAKFAIVHVENEVYALSSNVGKWIRLQLPMTNKAKVMYHRKNMVYVVDRRKVYVLGQNAKTWSLFDAQNPAPE